MNFSSAVHHTSSNRFCKTAVEDSTRISNYKLRIFGQLSILVG